MKEDEKRNEKKRKKSKKEGLKQRKRIRERENGVTVAICDFFSFRERVPSL